jgi:hypothetical protein
MFPTFVVLVASLVPPVDTLPKPRLIAKGETYFVHIVPPTSSTKDSPGRPMQVTHTRRDTGDMTILASADAAPQFFQFGGDIMRSSWDRRGIAGVRADDERAYVLATHSVGISTPAMGARGTTTAELRVFWLADGSRIGVYPLEKAETLQRFAPLRFPGQPEEIDDAGLLKADLDGVNVVGQVFRFRGKERVEAVADSPTTPRPALTYIASQNGYAIHAVHPLPPVADLRPAPGATPGTTILYVPFQAAQARVLVQTGDREQKREKGAGDFVPPPVTQTRVVSTTCDTERLYVLVWHGEWEITAMGLDRGPVLRPTDDYRLYVFWLADGSDLAVVKLTGGKKAVPEESVKRDLLDVFASGVKVFEQTIAFKGKERVKEK